MRWLDSTTNSMDMNLRKYWEILEDRRVWQAVVHGVAKRKDFTLLTNVCIVKAMVFPVVMYGCESWTIKKAEH